MNVSDILIHINNTLNAEQREELQESMRNIDGVIAPRFTANKDHLLLVAFNPDKTSTSALLSKVQSYGYHAQLVGV
ncbi:hypothetical protein TI05_14640 [Achromatium sp. WMS3]|nr:hypothetical protein TI05_14640 [Achromatium sp. WMS3]